MIRSFFAAALALITSAASAQLPDGSLAPDFVATDINGHGHHLYDLLDSGFVVVLEFSATWCGPCWTYHQSGQLEQFYDTYGPGTPANKVRVFSIESEPSNSTAQLYGPAAFTNDHTTTTQGDWVTGTPYPILDSTWLPSVYQVEAVPLMYTICPDRRLTHTLSATSDELWAMAQQCAPPSSGTDVAVVDYTGEQLICTEVTPRVTVQNLGATLVTGVDVDMMEGANTIATAHTDTYLHTYQMDYVHFPTTTVTDAAAIRFVVHPDAVVTNDTLDPHLMPYAHGLSHLTFALRLDHFCSETTWKLFDNAGVVVDQGGPYTCFSPQGGGQDAEQLMTYTWDLAPGCYALEVYDSYGDGMASNYLDPAFHDGHWEVFDAAGDTVSTGGGNFGTVSRTGFQVRSPAGITEADALAGVQAFPNPSTGLVQLAYRLRREGPVTVCVRDAWGRTVHLERAAGGSGEHQVQLDLRGSGAGLYVITIETTGQRLVRTITLTE